MHNASVFFFRLLCVHMLRGIFFAVCETVFLFSTFRLGESEDIGGAVSFLSCDQASYITGETLVIAGGMHSRL